MGSFSWVFASKSRCEYANFKNESSKGILYEMIFLPYGKEPQKIVIKENVV